MIYYTILGNKVVISMQMDWMVFGLRIWNWFRGRQKEYKKQYILLIDERGWVCVIPYQSRLMCWWRRPLWCMCVCDGQMGERRDEWTAWAVEKVALLSKQCLMQEPAGSTVWVSVYNMWRAAVGLIACRNADTLRIKLPSWLIRQ